MKPKTNSGIKDSVMINYMRQAKFKIHVDNVHRSNANAIQLICL